MYNSIWYQSLLKPPFSPPETFFAPVWSVLYFLIFLALIFYILSDKDDKKRGYIYFVVQLCLNLLWAPVFFGSKKISLAFIVLLFLTRYIYLTLKEFKKASNVAFWLLIPYFLWVLFALYLNLGYLYLNT
ncbi:MAG: tryptophan-rich sensory protein [Candidatus Gastranaerophilales bacterium]|nr:tryptophan-rich sensory protein [Candidatus Gastranaerophilales bacterium]